MALGATAVLVGRPYAYGLTVEQARQGVHEVLSNLVADTDSVLALSGRQSIAGLDAAMLTRPRLTSTLVHNAPRQPDTWHLAARGLVHMLVVPQGFTLSVTGTFAITLGHRGFPARSSSGCS